LQLIDPFHPAPAVRVRSLRALGSSIWTSLCFLLQTEAHVYAFAVAVNVLISFFPFLVAMIILCRSVLHWPAGVEIIVQTVVDYFPESFGVNFRGYLLTASEHKFSWLSVFLLLFTANGIFTPLEVAFNRIWRVKQNRSFLRNQGIGLGLIFICGILVLVSVSATAVNVQFLSRTFGSSHYAAVRQSLGFHLVALPVTMLMIFLIYWLLPNGQDSGPPPHPGLRGCRGAFGDIRIPEYSDLALAERQTPRRRSTLRAIHQHRLVVVLRNVDPAGRRRMVRSRQTRGTGRAAARTHRCYTGSKPWRPKQPNP
jgi:hypothetical protein